MSDLDVKRLSSGYWHIRGDGICNWAQPPTWPCEPAVLDAHTFAEAGDSFRRRAHAENARLLDEAEAYAENVLRMSREQPVDPYEGGHDQIDGADHDTDEEPR